MIKDSLSRYWPSLVMIPLFSLTVWLHPDEETKSIFWLVVLLHSSYVLSGLLSSRIWRV